MRYGCSDRCSKFGKQHATYNAQNNEIWHVYIVYNTTWVEIKNWINIYERQKSKKTVCGNLNTYYLG